MICNINSTHGHTGSLLVYTIMHACFMSPNLLDRLNVNFRSNETEKHDFIERNMCALSAHTVVQLGYELS